MDGLFLLNDVTRVDSGRMTRNINGRLCFFFTEREMALTTCAWLSLHSFKTVYDDQLWKNKSDLAWLGKTGLSPGVRNR